MNRLPNICIFLLILSLSGSWGWADAQTVPAKLPVELVVQALKLKAEKALEAKRKREAWDINVDTDVIEKFETNPNLNKGRKEDWAVVEDGSLMVKKHIYGPFTGQFDYFT